MKEENDDPLQKILPKVKFNCKGKSEGYYADNDFCELFHYCKVIMTLLDILLFKFIFNPTVDSKILFKQTNGFRFTFICPPNTYYSEKLMSCEGDSTDGAKRCSNSSESKAIDTQKTDDIYYPSAVERVEVYKLPEDRIHSNSNNSDQKFVTTSTASSTADPYLTRRRTSFGTRIKSDEIAFENKSMPFNEHKNEDKINTQITNNNFQQLESKVLMPFNGFSKNNRSQNGRNNRTDHSLINFIKSIQNNKLHHYSNGNSTNTSVKTFPIINPMKNEFQTNRAISYVSISNLKPNISSTTTSPPISLIPITTMSNSRTSSSTSPSTTFDLNKETQSKPNSFSVNYNQNYRNPEQGVIDQQSPVPMSSYQSRNQNRPQNEPIKYSKLINISPQRQTTINDNPDNRPLSLSRIQTETKTYSRAQETSPEFPLNIPQEVMGQEFLGYNLFNREKLFDDEFESQQTTDSTNSRTPAPNSLSNSRLHPSGSSRIKPKQPISTLREMIDTLTQLHDKQMRAENSEISEHRVLAPTKTKAETNSSKKESKKVLRIPLLVPIGLSKNHLEESISSSLLKPTVIPLDKNGEEIPAYVLHFNHNQSSSKKKKRNNRPKRQTFGFRNNYIENPFPSDSHYMPLFSSENNFDNYFDSGLSLNGFNDQSPIRSVFGIKPSAQQNIPYFMPLKHSNVNRPQTNFIAPNYDQNVFDLNEFTDLPNIEHIPFNQKPMPFAPSPQNNVAQYRSVSLKRPSFKRPPRRERIPMPEKNLNESGKKSSHPSLQTTQAQNIEKLTQTTRSPPTLPPSSSSINQFAPQLTNQPQFSVNTNPFSQISNANIGNIGDAIKIFDSSEEPYLPLNPSVFASQSLFEFNLPESQSNFIPSQFPRNVGENSRPIASTLSAKSSKNNIHADVNTHYSRHNQKPDNYLSQEFPPIPHFGDPNFRLPEIDILDPTMRNVFIPLRNINYNRNIFNTSAAQQDNQTTKNGSETIQFQPSLNYYQPEILVDYRDNDQLSQLNPNHNYKGSDIETLQTARTRGLIKDPESVSNSRSNWKDIISQYNSPNITITKTVSYSTKVEDDKKALNNGNNKQNEDNQRKIPFGERLNTDKSKIPTISVKSSVRSVSSINAEPTNQIIISKESANAIVISKQNNDSVKNDTNIGESYDTKANTHSDRITLLNYYNNLNTQKELVKFSDTSERLSVPKTTTGTTTSTTSPTTLKPPATSQWSIRDWTGFLKSHSSKATTVSPTTTLSTNKDFEIIDLFESKALKAETTTFSPITTTVRSESPYIKVFDSLQGASLQSNKNTRPQLFTLKSRPNLSHYLSSFTTTTDKTI